MSEKEKDCICYKNEAGATVRVLLCPVHGDAKATGGKKADRTPANDLRRKSTMKRSGPLNGKSEKEELRDAYNQGIKDKTIVAMMASNDGKAWCEKCEKDGPDTLEESRIFFELHHQDQRRAEGPRYNHETRDPGADHPNGQILVCQICHTELEADRS